MKKALMIASVLLVAVISTACINNIAVQELNNKAAEYMQNRDKYLPYVIDVYDSDGETRIGTFTIQE